jgi:hypothetical protein
MGLLGSLFGGDSKIDVEQASLLTKEQKDLFDKMLKYVSPRVGSGVEPYSGTVVPSAGPLLEQYLGAAGNVGASPLYTSGQSVLQRAMSMKPAWKPDMQAAENYWEDSFYRPAMTRFKREMLPAIREGYSGMGAYDSGGRHRAETRALADLATNLEGQRGSLMWGERQAGRTATENAMNRATNVLPQAMQYLNYPLSASKEAGIISREIEREPLEEQYQKWLMSRPWASPYWPIAQNLVNTRAVQPYGEQSGGGTGLLGGALATGLGTGLGKYLGGPSGFSKWLPAIGGAAVQALPAIMSMFSSREYKKDIEQIDEQSLALLEKLRDAPVYTYRYKGEADNSKKHIGIVTEEAPSEILTADGKQLDLVSYFGVLTAAVKALADKIDRLGMEGRHANNI